MSESSPPADGVLAFGVDARHIRQLGQELVGDRTTALTELIKNAYDADATWVQLRFDDSGEGDGILEVEDDGSGMALADLQRGWMRISTATKEDHDISPLYRRTRAGRKGIGRFATETLGRRLVLTTTTAGEPWALVVEFDWENDYPAGLDLGDVSNPYRTQPAPALEHGTTLRIEGLYDSWTAARRERVRKAVRLLQPPFPVAQVLEPDSPAGAKPDPGFQVEMLIDGEPDIKEDDPYEEFVASATARLQADVGEDGRVRVRATSDVYAFELEEVLGAGPFHATGPFAMDAAYYIYRSDAIGGISQRVAQEMARAYAGMRVYRDGLRVMPYGERGNDWLDLDKLAGARSGLLVPVANLNWFGQVTISRRTNPDLRDTASREGLVRNEAFEQLAEATRQALLWTAQEVGRFRQRKISSSGQRRASETRREIVDRARLDIDKAVRSALEPELAERVSRVVRGALDPSGEAAAESDQVETARVEALITEVELLRILASLGTSITVFSHEVRSALTTLTATLGVLRRDLDDLPDETQRRLDAAQQGMEELQDLTGYIDAYASASQRRNREPQALHTVVREFVERLSEHLARNVQFEWEVKPAALRTAPMARSELEAALINFLTNAMKAMDSEGHPERRVRISAEPDGSEAVLRFEDTGRGVDPKIRDRIFDPFVSETRSALSELGTGTGIGLKIVADIAAANGGSVALGDPTDGYATSFELRLPRWSKQDGTTG